MPCRGRVRALLAVWAERRWEERMRRERIWTGARTTPVHGKAATLALLWETVVQNAARTPGLRNPHPIVGRGRGLADLNSYDNDTSPSMGRARVRNPGPHPCPEPLPFLPYTWPQCLCRCRCPTPPSPPDSDSDIHSSDSSGPPSSESIMDSTNLESGYEASNSDSN